MEWLISFLLLWLTFFKTNRFCDTLYQPTISYQELLNGCLTGKREWTWGVSCTCNGNTGKFSTRNYVRVALIEALFRRVWKRASRLSIHSQHVESLLTGIEFSDSHKLRTTFATTFSVTYFNYRTTYRLQSHISTQLNSYCIIVACDSSAQHDLPNNWFDILLPPDRCHKNEIFVTRRQPNQPIIEYNSHHIKCPTSLHKLAAG